MRLKIPKQAKYRRRMGAFGGPDTKHDGSVISFNTAEECYNFDFSSGALRAGYGVAEKSIVPIDACRYWIYRYCSSSGEYSDQYVYQLANGKIMCYDIKYNRRLYMSETSFGPIDALNYRLNSKDVLLISTEGGKLMSWDGATLTEYDGPTVSSMALHYERLFVTSKDDPTKVFFSDDLDPTNWNIGTDEGGFIELLDERGFLNKVVSFGGYLYIFRDHGISRVTAYGDQREFSVSNLFVTAGRIYPQSIAVCGSGIIFLASDGMYSFDGYDCRRILTSLDGLIDPSESCASAYYNGKYYLACTMNFKDGRTVGCEAFSHISNGLLVFDVSTGDFSITRGVDIRFMSSCTYGGEDYLMCCDGGVGGVIVQNGMRFDTGLPGHWQSAETDFGTPDKVKAIREVYISTSAPCSLSLSSFGKTKTLPIKSGTSRKRINFTGKRLSLSADTLGGECNIEPPTLVYSLV